MRPLERVLVVDGNERLRLGGSMCRGLRTQGFDAHFFDEERWLGPARRELWKRAVVRAARPASAAALNVALVATATRLRPDVIIVCKGFDVDPGTIDALRRVCPAVTVFHSDDLQNPLNTRPNMIASVPRWDAIFTPRHFAASELRHQGARRVYWLPFGYDPEHFHPEAGGEDLSRHIVFVGTWSAEREEPLEKLAERFPLRVYGNGWERMRPSARLRPCLQYRPLHGRELRQVMHGAGVSLSFLRKGNRDLHTTRTFEIPACAGLMLTESTLDHRLFYRPGVEFEEFSDTSSLLDRTEAVLRDPERRHRITAAGRARTLALGATLGERARTLVEQTRMWTGFVPRVQGSH